MREGMEKKMTSLLLELLKDSKRSDREIAKVLGVSQPTVSRMRWRLEEEGWIKDFTVIPDFVKMGFSNKEGSPAFTDFWKASQTSGYLSFGTSISNQSKPSSS